MPNFEKIQIFLDTHKLSGLTNDEVIKRQNQGKTNLVVDKSSRTYWAIIVENAFNFINIVLFVISFLLILLNRVSDGIVYISVALLNVVVGLVQEIYAKIKLDQIANLTSPKAVAIRESLPTEIPTDQIVLNDLICLQEGSVVASDGELLAGSLWVDESFLTGESDRVKKEKGDEVFAGSFVINGMALYEVKKIGEQNLANQITSTAKKYVPMLTPLQKEVNITIRVLFFVSVVLAILVGTALIISEKRFSGSIESSAVIIGVIPNSLFAIINLAYALGGLAILRRGALVQKLNAIESLSHVDVLCLDKTGTITTKQMNLENLYPKKGVSMDLLRKKLGEFVASSSNLNSTTEAIKKSISGEKLVVSSEVEFSSDHKWSGVVVQNKTKKEALIFGATEVIGEHLKDISEFEETIIRSQEAGLRVLFFVEATVEKFEFKNSKPVLPKDLKILGLVVLSDQIRENIENTLKAFKKAGVELKIISGDNPQTVKNLATQVGFSSQISCISGTELEKMNEDEFTKAVKNNTVFGRISPKQKEYIVLALKRLKKYVAMTGDGVNDVLAIKQADVGIALESGAQATRNISDIILLKDSFEGLPSALIEGQKIRNSLQNVFKIYLTRVIYVVLIIVAVSILGLPFPLSVKQNAVVATLAAGLPALAITIWAKPRGFSKESLFSSVLFFVVPASLSLTFFAVTFYLGATLAKSYQLGILNTFLNSNLILRQAVESVVPVSRTFLTSFLAICGIILVNFVPFDNLRQSFRFDKKILAYSTGLFVIFIAIFAIPYQRNFWELNALSVLDTLVLFTAVLGWLATTLWLWKTRIVEKLLGITFEQEED